MIPSKSLIVASSTSNFPKCVVCKRPCNLFNYGANCCNACKMFFRRIKVGREPKPCVDLEKCEKGPKKCRYCRYQICLQAGMSIPNTQIHCNKYFELSDLITTLSRLNFHRKNQLINFITLGDPTFEDVVKQEIIPSIPKIENQKLDIFDWAFNAAITAVEFFKKFSFVNSLGLEDQKTLLKLIYINSNLLSCAFCAYQDNRAFMAFPDGCDVVPYTSNRISKVLENNIRCRLAGKMIELKISPEEYMLLTVVLSCNPASISLSQSAKTLISSHQRTYSSALLQLCLINFQQSGPSRFSDLLSVCEVISANVQDVMHHNILYKLYEPDKNVNLKRKFFQ